jgi:hypothetical protein
MTRARVAFAAGLVATALFADGTISGQAVQAPQLTPVLAGRKFVPPIKGEAILEYTEFRSARKGETVVTTTIVRNLSPQPVARLQVNEVWYDKDGGVLTSGRAVINGLLQPQEIQTLEIQTPWKAGMGRFTRRFSHANGEVKINLVKNLQAPKDAATPDKQAASTEKPAAPAAKKP